jgi:hypothetical protein
MTGKMLEDLLWLEKKTGEDVQSVVSQTQASVHSDC